MNSALILKHYIIVWPWIQLGIDKPVSLRYNHTEGVILLAHYEKTIDSKEIFRGRILYLTVDQVELEDGSVSSREVVRHPGGAAVLPLGEDGTVTLVRQFRYAFGRELLEIPAGKLEPGEDPKIAAVRELEEECGLLADEVTELGCVYPSVGYDDEIIYLYLARELRETSAKPDQGEFVTMEHYPLSRLVDLVKRGEIRDAKTVTAILKTHLLHPNV